MDRRRFVTAAALGLAGCGGVRRSTESSPPRTTPTIDLHSHAGRIIPSRNGDFDRPFGAVAQPMRAGGMDVICLAVVADTPVTRIENGTIRAWREPEPGELHEWFVKAQQRAHDLIEREGLAVVVDAATLRDAIGRPSAIVASEGADFLEGRIERVDEAYDRFGLRHLQLTHYRVNELGDIQTVPAVHGGLTAFGRDVVRRCNARGIVVDVAHAPFETVRGVVDAATRPIVLSHTSLTSLTSLTSQPRPFTRTITPEHARLVAGTGGVIGIWPPASRFPSLAALAEGMRAMADVTGPEHVGLGTDMLGLTGRSIFDSYAELPALREALTGVGFRADEIAGVLGGNYARVFTAAVAS
jgi:membrane dipeptidase